MPPEPTFMDLYRRGEVKKSDIVAYVDWWQFNRPADSLHIFLGLSRSEFAHFMTTKNLPGD